MISQFNPNKFIKDRQNYSDYQCAICYELTENPVRCKGPCHKAYCLKCVTLTKKQSKRCPLRCSQQFQVEQIPNVQISFVCPFNYQACHAVLPNRQTFNQHHKECQYVSEQYRLLLLKREQFQCDQGHRLLYLNTYLYREIYKNNQFWRLQNQNCISCKEDGICTSICLQCTTEQKKATYCLHCRKIPCTKFQCPLGHYFLGKGVHGIMGVQAGDICYLCGLSPALLAKTVYFDKMCGLDICNICQSTLNSQNELIPLNHEIYNRQDQRYEQMIADFRRDNELAAQQARQAQQSEDQQSNSSESSSERQQDFASFLNMIRNNNLSVEHYVDEDGNQQYILPSNVFNLPPGARISIGYASSSESSQRSQQAGPIENQSNEQSFYSIESDPQLAALPQTSNQAQSHEKVPGIQQLTPHTLDEDS